MPETLRRSRLAITLGIAYTISACVSIPPESEMEQVVPDQTVTARVAAGEVLELSVPAGDVVVQADDGDNVNALLRIKCPPDSKSCAEWAANTELTIDRADNRVLIVVSEPSRISSSTKITVVVPRWSPMSISMGYGNLQVQNLASDLSIDMKAGSVSINSPHQETHSVLLTARFGDVELHNGSDREVGDRRFLVGAKLDWQDGQGEHRINANVRYGDIRTYLTQ